MQVTAGGPPISVSVVVVDPATSVTHVSPEVAVTRVVPVLQLAYIEIAFAAVMDDSGLYQYKTDMTAVVDSTAIAFSRPVLDSFSLSDASLFAFTKGPIDSVGTSDVCLPVLVFLRDFADTLVASETKFLSYAKPNTDSVAATDAAPVRGFNKNLADAFAMNDMADIADGIAFQFDDYTNNVVTTSDGTVVVVAPVYLDSVAFVDSSTTNFMKGVADSVSGPDTLAISFSGAYTDSTTLADNPAIGFSRPVTDSFSQSDTSTRASALLKTDSFALTEAGSMLVQDYVVAGYFAEDYVGTLYTF